MSVSDDFRYPDLFTPTRSHNGASSKIVYVMQEEDYQRLWDEITWLRVQRRKYKRRCAARDLKLAKAKRMVEVKIGEIDFIISRLEIKENG
jgi:hypothetical protein